MPAVAPAAPPSLSQIESWDTNHLTSAATHWTVNATSWENAATELCQQMPSPGGHVWQGHTAEAAQERAQADRLKVIATVDELHVAAAIARKGASELDTLKCRVTATVAEARAAGLTVNDDLSVEYTDDGTEAAAAKHAQAFRFATDIRKQAIQLATLDQRIAGELTAVATSVSLLNFPEAPPGVPPPEGPDVDALSVRDAQDVHKIVDPLPPGKQPHVKVLPTQEAVRGLFETLTTNASPAPPSSYPGESRILEDGTRISLRPDSKSGGTTIDIVYPDKTNAKIHVEDLPKSPPTRVPIPEPAPAPAPITVPAPEPVPETGPTFELPTPTIGAPAVPPEDVGVVGTHTGFGIGILVAIGTFGEWVFSP